jgi:serine phosphatase RsbU (regulator of sigma subunit)/anti-sigma regulatory factor (Ser/Thr protein kinase)
VAPGVVGDSAVPEPDAPAAPGPGQLSSLSARTLVLGVDHSGQILQHDRAAPGAFGLKGDDLLGACLSDLVAEPQDQQAALKGLLEAVRNDRENTAMLTIKCSNEAPADAVVTVQPVCASQPGPAALVVIRIPPSNEERFLDPALMRRALLDDSFTRAGATLDLDQMARGLINLLVPHFSNVGALLVLESLVGADESHVFAPDGMHALRRLAVAYDDSNQAWDATFPTGELLSYPPGTMYVRCMDSGRPVLETNFAAEDATRLAKAWRRMPVARLLSGASMLLLPLIAGGTTLGFFVCARKPGYRRFDAYDTEIGMEFASRAAIFIDTARRFSRERATALTLQRSMLPTGLSAPSSVEVRHRYLPASKLIEVGGDWYESIALPGARVALVVGDVAGHGVRAAVTMGRLRTAIQTLARLELSPAESLQQLDELMRTLGEREPHFATCAYAVFDAVNGTCEVASAGHLPPLLVRPDGSSIFLDVPPAPPLGIGEGLIQSQEFQIDDGSLFVLYTDGLVEKRDRDIDDGLTRLRDIFGADSLARPLEDLCKATLDGVYADEQRDDIAVLIARLRRLPSDHYTSWTLDADPVSVGAARALVRSMLKNWDLSELSDTTELLVSELVTNALRYANGQITVRLVLEHALVCEVLDDSAALPRLRHAGSDDETGRGLHVVGQFAKRWGTRRTASGKVVWCEQPIPARRPRGSPAEDDGPYPVDPS